MTNIFISAVLRQSWMMWPIISLPGFRMADGGRNCFYRNGYKNAAKIYKRDRRNHASPNSAQTEAAMAGALDVQLAGNAYYFGKLYEKPTIGDPIRPVEPEDIKRANRLMYAASILGVVVFGLLSAGSGSGY